MAQSSEVKSQKKIFFALGIGLVVFALLLLIGLGVWLFDKSGAFESEGKVSKEAVLFIDAPGRIAIDGSLQVNGPSPVLVTAKKHTLTFFDINWKAPVEVFPAQNEFLYVPNPATSRSPYRNGEYGLVNVSAFPPDTTIEVLNCAPVGSRRPYVCNAKQVLRAELSPGTYTIKYSNPNFGDYQEDFTIGVDSVVHRDHSFITTVSQWAKWVKQNGELIEEKYPTYRRNSGGEDIILLPFRATGLLLDELFD